jgi:hypothetical protein
MSCSSRPHSPSDRSRSWPWALAVFVAALAPWVVAPPVANASPGTKFSVIVSPDVELTKCSIAELRRLFGLERQFWNAGHPVVVLLPATGTSTQAFLLRRIYRTDVSGLKRLILEKLYRGEIDLAPKSVTTDRQAISFVASSQGLVAVVPSQLAAGSGVRQLRIDGKLPEDAGYPLTE